MSLTKLLSAPIKLFQKDVIAFLIVRRYDLGLSEDLIRYITIRPSASIATLRRKIWYLLNLPDYCEEVIILKTSDNVEIPLSEIRSGNEPGCPFILEVWLPGKETLSSTTIPNHMLTMGRDEDMVRDNATVSSGYSSVCVKASKMECCVHDCHSTMTDDTLSLNKLRVLPTAMKKSDLSAKFSNTSILFKIPGKKNKDNFTNILLKIQTDLTVLSTKLSSLENRIPA